MGSVSGNIKLPCVGRIPFLPQVRSRKPKMKTVQNIITVILVFVCICLPLAGCRPALDVTPSAVTAVMVTPTTAPTAAPTASPVPTATDLPFPDILLIPDSMYFTQNGRQSFLFSRNIAAYTMQDFDRLLPMAYQGGTRLVRIQVSTIVAGGMGFTPQGELDEDWAQAWDKVFETAEANGISVWVVFTGWYDWNTTGYNNWAGNPFNAANGGPAKKPQDLFKSGSKTQELWMGWLKTIANRWQRHENILIWEVYSEANLTQGVSEAEGVAFVERASALIREADELDRPITNSLADIGNWESFNRSSAVEFINIHPYPPSAQLDRMIINNTRLVLDTYHKPVAIGESGLSAETPDIEAGKATVAENSKRGVSHAIWAAVVSGAMNGRGLYWEDGYGIYFPKLSWAFLNKYANTELAAARFVENVNFAGYQPLAVSFSSSVWGGAAGNEQSAVGWVRDAACEPPEWPLLPVVSGQTVTITLPGSAANWQVDFYDTKTGLDVIATIHITRTTSTASIPLPDFQDDLAFRLTAIGGTITESGPATDAIAGDWQGRIGNAEGSFSTVIEVTIQPGCDAGQICGTFGTPELNCTGNLFLQEVNGDTFVFIEQISSGGAACASGGYEFLQLQADGTLAYQFSFSRDAAVSSTGILTRH